jgi:2'-5' RNA ligase
MEMQARISGVAIPIAIPSALAAIRDRWDFAAAQGAQPHVTVLFPFLPEVELTDAVRAALGVVAALVAPFDVRFANVRRFEGVVWIEPEPTEPFRRLTQAMVERWPDYPPYGGVHDTVIPHLTVAESETGPLASIADEARRAVPFTARAEVLELWTQDDAGRWRPFWSCPLGVRP